jgi:hypothetical protein
VKGAVTLSRAIVAAVIGLFTLAGPAPARADDTVQLFAGAQADFSNYVYAGATVALPGQNIDNGFAVRGYLDSGGYDYMRHALGVVNATFSGGELDAVYGLTYKHFWSNVGAGINSTYTGLAPYDVKNELRGGQVEFRVSLNGGGVGGPWRADWGGYYGTRLEDYDAMVGVTHRLTSKWRLGAQVAGTGNPNYNLRQAGPYAAVAFDQRSELQFSTGGAWESGFTPRLYVNANFFRRF